MTWSRLLPVAFLLAVLGATGCRDAAQPPTEAPAAETTTTPAPPVSAPAAPVTTPDPSTLRQVALRLAGLPGDPEGPILAGGEVWARHAEQLAGPWSEIEARHLQPIRTWAASEMAPLAVPEAPLFYPFGGPDILNAVHFFPQASTYVLVGLEPPGEILLRPTSGGDSQELASAASASLTADLERLRGALASVVESGYFVTKRMESDLASGQLNGVLPVLLLFLARTGHVPTAATYIELAADGSVQELAQPTAPTAVRIDFPGGRLFFFSLDLSDRHLGDDDRFLQFLGGLGGYNVYLKSASYLLAMAEFSILRDVLLAQAQAVLEDDSGIPLRFFSSDDWELHFYGTYTTTLPSYREWFQGDLQQVYASRRDIPPLPFALGYNSQIGGSCLILAERRPLAED